MVKLKQNMIFKTKLLTLYKLKLDLILTNHLEEFKMFIMCLLQLLAILIIIQQRLKILKTWWEVK